MEPFATVQDVEDLWRQLSGQEQEVAEHLLVSASAIIRREFPTVDTRLGAGELDETVVKTVTVDMTKRVLRNPAGVMQQTTGPYSITFDREALASRLHLLDEERALLRPKLKRRRGTIRLRAGLA